MKQIKILLLFFSLIMSAQAQSSFTFELNKEGKIIAIPKEIELNLNVPSFDYKSYTPQTTTAVENNLKKIEVETQSLPSVKDRPMNMQLLSAAYLPFFNPYASMLRRVSPQAFDFREIELVPINESLTFSVLGLKDSWIGTGGVTSLSPALTWRYNNLALTGGAFVTNYYSPFNISPEYMGGFYTHAGYELSNRFGVDMWGQYAIYDGSEEKNPHLLMSPFYDHTRAGGGIRMKITEKFSVGAGMQYEYNPVNRKWNRQFLVYPIFK
ncbi:hypothetical protein [Parabacteroides sp. Marseille-P3160]|uniref:hypothetical protein n=1 Tax=Parabacteroides sp. Marseille-P3160 TaxID=1917887 RepID=UPI00111A4823|nr:hypothetical protein [Parabacteroides sp. Marseille-P3160]